MVWRKEKTKLRNESTAINKAVCHCTRLQPTNGLSVEVHVAEAHLICNEAHQHQLHSDSTY